MVGEKCETVECDSEKKVDKEDMVVGMIIIMFNIELIEILIFIHLKYTSCIGVKYMK